MSNNATAATAANCTNKSNAQPSSVPFVVRVTFLGVAGILANPQTDNERAQTESPQLHFPLPSNLRAVASISRTYKSGGRPSGLSNCLSKPPSPGGVTLSSALAAVEPERFVAVWNDDCKEVNQRLINKTNDVAFEAELVPLQCESENDPSTTFAPKTFCVTLGLVADTEEDETLKDGGVVSPMVAIPIGFSNLTITGEETLNGRRKQVDLPLTSVNNLIGPFGVESPLIKLTKAGGAGAVAMSEGLKKKPKNMVKRIFKKGAKSANGAYNEANSIFQLGRPPNNEERNLFLERFSVDQSGDAIVRVALEVFPRGSELEKAFKQKAKLRKKKQLKQAEMEATATVTPAAEHTSVRESRDDIIAASISSLVDDVDDESSYSDYSQSYTQISSDGETWDDGNTSSWVDDEETFATFEDTIVTMDTMDTRDLISAHPSTPKAKGVFGRMFECAVPTCTAEDDYLKVDEYNIDTVASAVASMSVTDSNSMQDGPPEKNITSSLVTTTPEQSTKTKSASDVARDLNPKPEKSTNDALHDSDVAEVLAFNDASIEIQHSSENTNLAVPNGSNLNDKENNLTVPSKKEKTRGGFSVFRRNHTKKKR